MSNRKARVVVVDDHPLFRERLCQLINNEQDMEICGEAESAQPALQIIRETEPNLAIVDITLKTSSGLELIKWHGAPAFRHPLAERARVGVARLAFGARSSL